MKEEFKEEVTIFTLSLTAIFTIAVVIIIVVLFIVDALHHEKGWGCLLQ